MAVVVIAAVATFAAAVVGSIVAVAGTVALDLQMSFGSDTVRKPAV